MADVMILARLAWLRLWRGRTKWVTALLAVLPPCFAALLLTDKEDLVEVWQITTYFTLHLAVLLAIALHLSSAVGEELESRTYTYLWSRPMRRSAVLFGKLIATAPPVAAAFLLSLLVTWVVVFGADAAANVEWLIRASGAALATVVTGAALTLATSAIVTRWPLAFLLGYLTIGQWLLEWVPVLQKVSIAFHAAAISGAHPPQLPVGTIASGVVGSLILSVVLLGLAVWRVESAEYALPDA